MNVFVSYYFFFFLGVVELYTIFSVESVRRVYFKMLHLFVLQGTKWIPAARPFGFR